MGRDTSYAEALDDLEADIGRRVVSGDDEGLSDETLLKRWEEYRKGRDLTYYPSRTMELLHREERLVRGMMGPVGCLAGECRIWTERGLERMDELYRRGEPFRVWSMRKDGSVGLEWATAPFVKGREPLLQVDLEGGGSFRGAAAHLVWIRTGTWKKLSDLQPGSCMRTIDEQKLWTWRGVESIELETMPETYYDLTVESTGNYIGEWGIVHHNSGKTVGLAADMNMRHLRQYPCRDGVVRDRFSMVRGTLTLLKVTLVDTWMAMFPRTQMKGSKYGVFGTLEQTKGGVKHILELRGFGLDKAGALGNLLSNNFSGGMINEATTISEKAKDGVVGRCGRYPDLSMAPPNFKDLPVAWKDSKGYWRYFKNHGVGMDTNAASEDSWWYKKSRDGGANPEKEVYFEQPPAAFKVWDDDLEKWKYELNEGQRPGIPPAENIEHLNEHWDYYQNIIDTSGSEHVDRYVCCLYSKTEVGDPVFSDFAERWHVAKNGVPWPPPGTRLIGGMDFGQTRRAVLGYIGSDGRLNVFAEAVDQTGSVETFANNVLRPMLAAHGFSITDLTLYCDPAALNRSEHSPLGGILLMRGCGFDAVPPARLPNNDIGTRLEAVRHFLNRIINNKGAVQIDPGCTTLIRSVGGGYVWGRRKIGAEYMNTDEPAKNAHSHIADAFEYMCCGARWGVDQMKLSEATGRGYVREGSLYVPAWQRAGDGGEEALC